MKNKLMTAICCGVLLGSGVAVQAGEPGGHGSGRHFGKHKGHHGRGGEMMHITRGLNLTPEQEAKIKPIVEQAKPQMLAIHEEAMQKRKAVMDNSVSQIRPLLTPEQQAKFDRIRAAREEVMKARRALREAQRQQ